MCDHKKQHLVHPYHDSWYETHPRRHLRSDESRFLGFHTCAPRTMVCRRPERLNLKTVVWFKLVATLGSGSKEPETPRETLLVCRETVTQHNQRNSPCWYEPNNESKSVQNWTTPCSCVHVLLFLSCCVTISPTNAFSFPLSSDYESTDVFLTIQILLFITQKHSKDSPDENVPWHFVLLRCAWVLLLTVY